MKLFSPKLEIVAILSILRADKSIAGFLLSSVDTDDFGYPPTSLCFRRIKSLLQEKGVIPSYEEMSVDLVISEDHRNIVFNSKKKPVKSIDDAKGVHRQLENYRKVRKLYEAATKISDTFKSEKVDVDSLLDSVSLFLSQAKTKNINTESFMHLGVNLNANPTFKDLLSDEKPDYIPTGFKTYDSRNGGILPGSLWSVGATTGGGKSSLASQLLLNMSRSGYKVCLISLEMSKKEILARIMSNLSGIPLTKIIKKDITKNEKKKLIEDYKAYNKTLKSLDASYSVFVPDQDVSIEDISFLVRPYGFKVVIIDYISLLKDTGGDQSWQKLGEVARYCKVWAGNMNIVVVLLAQINSESKMRYSQAVVEHSSNAWFWIQNDSTRESGIIEITQPKARNQEPFKFQLGQDTSLMRFFDIDSSTADSINEKEDTSYLEDISNGND